MEATKAFRIKLKYVAKEMKELSQNSIFLWLVRNEFKMYYLCMGGVLLCSFIW
ncbi:hypothetical protein [uncultured Mediterranean phage uvMED]|nr:hypothetical protein [uncultured Mediterranean phage uvMED]BAQ87206.1 hypothetical protein [uncultured Mediterranean phage uvMED]BAQ87279.1 hypothetical protein [uncultured Mediterranean phage uvMED]BAQ87292.1 hypothetical protein [uncultured Mediterranean phage uvMED]BAQ87378.1 hypothetical protein [uncultured Mediterranean phage uvMED]